MILNGTDVSNEEELAADMMSLLASFSGKFYGRREKEKGKEIGNSTGWKLPANTRGCSSVTR